MRRIRLLLAAVIGGLLVSGVVTAQLVGADVTPDAVTSSPAIDASTARTSVPATDQALGDAAGSRGPGGPSTAIPPPAAQPTAPRTREATPDLFVVPRDRPRVDETLRRRLATTAATDVLTVFVHAASAPAARDAARSSGLRVLATYGKVGVALAAGSPAAVRAVTQAERVSFVEAEPAFHYAMETAPQATRSNEARKGFDVTYLEPQPDKPGTSKRVCTTKRVRNNRTGRTRRVRSCRTVTTPPQPQPPVTRTVHSPGVDGSGVTIAFIDTGVDGTHPMFQLADGTSKVVRNLKVAVGCDTQQACETDRPIDEHFVAMDDTDTVSAGGHGTHVAGIAGGVDVITSDGRRLHGVAPAATLVALSAGTFETINDPVTPLNWVLTHHRDPCGDGACPPIRVLNNSWGGGGSELEPESVVSKLQRALVMEGVVVVWAAGNSGGDGSVTQTGGWASDPTPGVLSVGNYDDAGNGTRSGRMHDQSSRGEKGRPGTYPDVAAPGMYVTSACRATLPLCHVTGDDWSDPDYGTISGTSMAAPHVAGVVAQLLQANPSLTPAQVEDILEDTAHPTPLGAAYEPDPANPGTLTSFDRGHGLVDAAAAVARARALPALPEAPPTCRSGDADVTDVAGDAYESADLGGVPATSNPRADVIESRLGWDAAGAVTFETRLVDVERTEPLSSSVIVGFAHDDRLLAVRAERTAGGEAFTLHEGFSGVVPGPTLATGLTGSFDAGSNVVSITLTNAKLAEANVSPFAPGEYVQATHVLAGTDGIGAVDLASATCPHRLGTGVTLPPGHTTIGPDVVLPVADAAAALAPGSRYDWEGGPHRANLIYGCTMSVLGEDCRDDIRLDLDVPSQGARLTVTVTPDRPQSHYDVFVRDPDGTNVAVKRTSVDDIGQDGVARVAIDIDRPGRYVIVVEALQSLHGSYHGEAALTAAG